MPASQRQTSCFAQPTAHCADLQAAFYYARQLGLSEADREDCAMSFVLHLLERDKAPPRDALHVRS